MLQGVSADEVTGEGVNRFVGGLEDRCSNVSERGESEFAHSVIPLRIERVVVRKSAVGPCNLPRTPAAAVPPPSVFSPVLVLADPLRAPRFRVVSVSPLAVLLAAPRLHPSPMPPYSRAAPVIQTSLIP